MWKAGYYSWLLEFLDVEDSKKLFIWIEKDEVMLTNANPPKFYGKWKAPNLNSKKLVLSLLFLNIRSEFK